MKILAPIYERGYIPPVAVNPVAGLGNPNSERRESVTSVFADVFSMSAISFYGGCTWEDFGPAGLRLPRFSNPCTAVTHSLGNERDSFSQVNGTTRMTTYISPTPTPPGRPPNQQARKMAKAYTPEAALSHSLQEG